MILLIFNYIILHYIILDYIIWKNYKALVEMYIY